jgi:hypothetical protein
VHLLHLSQKFPKNQAMKRAGRQEGSGEECRLALHFVFSLPLFLTIFSFLRNCPVFWLKFGLFSKKILNENGVALRRCFLCGGLRLRSARREDEDGRRPGGVGEGRRPSSLFAFGLCRTAIFSRGCGGGKKHIENLEFLIKNDRIKGLLCKKETTKDLCGLIG